MEKIVKAFILILNLIPLMGFTTQELPNDFGQPKDERKAQENLPQSNDVFWDKFAKSKITLDKKTYKYKIRQTAEIKSMIGKIVEIKGFILPLEAQDKFKHFLLSKRTPTCYFCPPGEANEIVEVFLKKPIKWEDGIFTVKGKLYEMNNPQMGLFFRLKDAEIEK